MEHRAQDGEGKKEAGPPLRRNKIEAVVIHKATNTETYADILRRVKSNINMEELGIRDTRIRRTATGSLLIQIAGEESKNQADALAEKVRHVVGEDAKVGRPCRRAEIRVSGLDEDTTPEDVIEAVARQGECDRNDIRVGNICRNRQGEGDISVKCPRSAAVELSRRRRMRIGWVGARVDIMEPAPL